MSTQLILSARDIRGKDWTKMNLLADAFEKAANSAQEARLDNAIQCRAKCRTPNKGTYEGDHMNNLEAKYARHLDDLMRHGEIVFWRFESMKLVLADRCTYLPDFFIVKADGTPEFHETKGFWREDARVKVKMAAKLFPCFVFYGVKWDRKCGWLLELFSTKAQEG